MEQSAVDYKDWTRILPLIWPEYGDDAATVSPEDVGPRMRSNAASFRAALKRGDIVHERPPVPAGEPAQPSALEVAAHVRDQYASAAERLARMIKKKSPKFGDWDRNEAASNADYSAEDPDKVSYALAVNAGKAADILDKVRGDQWQRIGIRSDGAQFTIASFAVYVLHDMVHHLTAVEQGYAAIIEAKKKKD
ncbi:MAG: hypothetical protein AAF531_28085 [Actinomycetota bacterium]